MDNQQNVEIEAVKAKIIELEADRANYFHQYEAAPDNLKPAFLELMVQVTKQTTSRLEQLVQLERQKTVIMERTPSPSESRPLTPAIVEDSHEIFNSWKKRVFRIVGDNGQGSGVLISKKHVLTAAHISFRIDKTYNVFGTEGSFQSKVIFICRKFDFAVLTSESFPDMDIAPINVSRGNYFLMGYPDGANRSEPTITRGFIEGMMADHIHLIGTPSRRGFSGGPVLHCGNLAGILLGGLHGFTLNSTFKEYLDSSAEQRYARILPVSCIILLFNEGGSDTES